MIGILIEGMTENKGGKETYILNAFNTLDKEQYRFHFISYSEEIAYEAYLRENGADIVRIPPRNKAPLAYYKALKRVMEEIRPDVLWAHKTTLSACESLMAAKEKKVPARIVHSHSSANMGNGFTYLMHSVNKALVGRWANEFLACSENAAAWFYGSRPAVILRNAVNLTMFRYDPEARGRIRQALDLETKTVVGHVGRFGVEKNHTKLLRVFHKLHEMDENTTLVLCGDGPERDHITALIEELGLQDSVRMLGVVDNVHEVLQAMDVLVMPSLFEGVPFALLEAQAAGLKCIVSDTVSRESDVMGWNQFLPLEMDDADWAKAIQELDLSYDRNIGYSTMKELGYDIRDNIALVEEIMQKHCGERA